MEQRWGLPLIAWPSRLRPNFWDLVALPIVLGAIALVAWGGMAMSARYQIGEALPISLDPWRLPEYALRTVLRMGRHSSSRSFSASPMRHSRRRAARQKKS